MNTTKPERLVSLDAFRGFIMLLMASGGFGLASIAKQHSDSGVWQFIGHHTEHVEWTGCSLWDLIQPAFMFMVGVALPWSIAKRQACGQSFTAMLGHAFWRGLLLVLIAVFLTSAWRRETQWEFPNVLAQIGLGYPLLFLLAFTKSRTTLIAAFGVLAAYWLAFALYPLPAEDFDWAAVGVPADWTHLQGFGAHWEKNSNFAAAFDQSFLNLFPRSELFTHNRGGYQTLNFIPSLATMIFGLLAGRLLRSELSMIAKIKRLVVAGVLGILLGFLIDALGICANLQRHRTEGPTRGPGREDLLEGDIESQWRELAGLRDDVTITAVALCSDEIDQRCLRASNGFWLAGGTACEKDEAWILEASLDFIEGRHFSGSFRPSEQLGEINHWNVAERPPNVRVHRADENGDRWIDCIEHLRDPHRRKIWRDRHRPTASQRDSEQRL